MGSLDGLLRAILAHPAEDTPRLMYADELEGIGGRENVDRAALIRVQIEVAKLPNRCERILARDALRDSLDYQIPVFSYYTWRCRCRICRLRRAAYQLFQKGAKKWTRAVMPQSTYTFSLDKFIVQDKSAIGIAKEWKRGFPTKLIVSLTNLYDFREALATISPFEKVEITDREPMLIGSGHNRYGWALPPVGCAKSREFITSSRGWSLSSLPLQPLSASLPGEFATYMVSSTGQQLQDRRIVTFPSRVAAVSNMNYAAREWLRQPLLEAERDVRNQAVDNAASPASADD